VPSAASTDPFWSVTLRSLRELTRLAVAALVLAIGLGGVTAAPASSAPTLGPVAASSPAVASTPFAAIAPVDRPLPRREPAAERVVDAAAPPTVRRAETPVASTARLDVPARDPGRGVPSRRGPPTA
jgi:hypothetical protein